MWHVFSMSNLPESCYAVLLSNGVLIEIRRGESGYYGVTRDHEMVKGNEARIIRDEMNETLGVSIRQRVAMEHGSMFGWDTPGANPDHPLNVEFERDELERVEAAQSSGLPN